MLHFIFYHIDNKNIEEFKELLVNYTFLLKRPISDGEHIVHRAAQVNCVEIIQHIIEQESSCLELTDASGRTPLMLAAMAGHCQVVEYLLSVDANAFYSQNSASRGGHPLTALYLANSEGKYDTANILLLHMLNEENRQSILNFITHPIEAMEYMLFSESNSRLVLDTPRLRDLIEQGAKLANNRIGFYKPKARRKSIYYELDLQTGQVFKFTKSRMLGHGTNGVVFDFVCESEHRAVKYFETRWVNSTSRLVDAYTEFNNRELVYPGINSFFHFSCIVTDGLISSEKYSVRDVTELIPGETLFKYIAKISAPYECAEIYLLVAQELIRVQNKLVHGDVKENNIMVYSENGKLKVKFIDFGCSNKLTDDKADTYVVDKSIAYMAPERLHRKKRPIIAPNPNQDVYSLGYMYNKLIDNLGAEFREELNKYFTCIDDFIRTSVQSDPNRRPSLPQFAEALSIEYKSHLDSRQVVVFNSPIEPA